MSHKKPYYTSDDLVDAVKRKIAYPLAQNTFTPQDVLAFANEEMMISQVPSVLEFHKEFFVHKKTTAIVSGVGRYSIPDRAIGMRLRDLFYSDSGNKFIEMSQVSSEDKSYFQENIAEYTTYYLENNDIVLTPSTINSGGYLNFFFYLRPNQLVANSRAATIQSFSKTITVTASALTAGDTLTITRNNNTTTPSTTTLTCSNRSITSSSVANPSVITLGTAHGKTIGQTYVVRITEHTGSTPSINGEYTATITGATTFTIPVNVTVGGSGGKVAFADEFSIGSTDTQTATNLSTAINDSLDETLASASSNSVTYTYENISEDFSLSLTDADALVMDLDNIYINFDHLDTTWTDPLTNETDELYEAGVLVDFLQTKPGHKTYVYDVELLNISSTRGKFLKTDLMWYPNNTSGSGSRVMLPIEVGDYICLQHECIIPQIPPDLHTGLAERTAARIMAAIGDEAGLTRASAKVQEIEGRQGTLLGARVDGSPMKVTGRNSILRRNKSRFYR